MYALVTGAGGFLGRYLVRQLVMGGHRVRVFCRRRYEHLQRLGVDCIEGDLRNPQAVWAAHLGVDVVFHAAGVAGIWGPWEPYYQANTLGTRHVIEACRACGVRRLIYTSTPSVTFDGHDQQGIDESAPYANRWLCHYPHSKALAEQMVLGANRADLLTCALRPHLIWGPGDPHLIPRLLTRARLGRLRRVGPGTNLIDTVYVENAAEAHLLAAEALHDGSPVAGRAYFITQGTPVNCWDWIGQILARAGLPPIRKAISFAAAWRLGAFLETAYGALAIRREPPMTRFVAAQLARDHYFDITRARRDLGYQPRVSIEEGMDRLDEELENS